MTTYNTGNPVGSTDARDLYDNAQALDQAVNGSGTYTDRLGHSHRTLSALEDEFPNAAANAATATTQAGVATTQAGIATTQAGVATTQAGVATEQASAAKTAKTAAESARDAALIQAGVYVDEPTGRAAVANGVAFKVQGSGDVAAYEYRRVNATTVSTLIATYPAKAAYDSLKTIVGNGPKSSSTFSSTLTFDDDEIVDSYLQTGAITFTLAASGHKLGVSKRITIIGDGSGISFGFTVGVQQGVISASKLNTIYMVYVGNSTVDLHIVNSDTALSDTTNLLALVQADSASKLTLSGSNVTAMIDQSPQQSNFAATSMPYDSVNKFITPTGGRFTFTTRSVNNGNFTLVLAARFSAQIGDMIFLGNNNGSAAIAAKSDQGIVDNLFGRAAFQSATDASAKISGDSVIVIVGTSSAFRVYINNVLIAEKTTGGPYSGVAALKSLLMAAENYTISIATRIYEFRLLNKAYLDAAQLTQLYNDVKNRYSLDTTIYPTLSGLTYTGTPVAGGTITAAWTYNQNAAGPIGRYRIEWRWNGSAGGYWFYMYSPGGKVAINDPVSPSLMGGKYWRYRVIVQDDQGRCSKVAYESADIYVP